MYNNCTLQVRKVVIEFIHTTSLICHTEKNYNQIPISLELNLVMEWDVLAPSSVYVLNWKE